MRVVIVGGGVIGLAQAWSLARRGVEVTVLDAGSGGPNASTVNAGWIVPAMASPVPAPGVVTEALRALARRTGPVSIRPSLDPTLLTGLVGMWRASTRQRFRAGFAAQLALAERTDGLIEDWLDDGVAVQVHRDGALLAHTSRTKLAHQSDDADLPAARGRPLERLSGDEARALEPTLSERVVGAVLIPTEWHVDPAALVLALAARVRELGGTLLADTDVTSLRREHDRTRVVAADGAEHRGDAIVLAAGAWTGRLARTLGVRLPIIAGTGLSLDLEAEGLPVPRRMLYLAEERVAMTPLGDRLRLAGTMRFGAPRARRTAAVARSGRDGAVDPIERVDRVRARAVARSPRSHLAEWPDDATIDRATRDLNAGARPMTPDGLPAIGRLPGTSDVWVSTGHGMMGVTLASTSAAALTTAMVDGALPDVLAPFDPARFDRGRRARVGSGG